jgi:carbon storage regulator CsrA
MTMAPFTGLNTNAIKIYIANVLCITLKQGVQFMLILTRRIGETVIIGENEITIKVLAVHGPDVRLGIVTPKGVIIHKRDALHPSTNTAPPVDMDMYDFEHRS